MTRLSTLWVVIALSVSGAYADEPLDRGEYVFRAAGCDSCHTDHANNGAALAGGAALDTPFGTFYAPNISPDPVHGIGGWGEEDFIRAMREGESPEGDAYYPVFPYPTYARIGDQDLRAMYRWLMTTPPEATSSRDHEVPFWLSFRIFNDVWQWLFLDVDALPADEDATTQLERGAYLVNALTHCDECHTPRNRFGALDLSNRMSGAPITGDEAAPNISPDTDVGVGNWKLESMVEYLRTGIRWDEEFAGGAMAEVIDNSTSHLTREDLVALSTYLFSLPPRQN